ncbi:MAG: nucleoside deaminase [Bacteroidetes bacterium]|nr:nucleoside deaminase [Bacteroidota bacterium]
MKDLINYVPYMEIAIQEAEKSLREGNHGFGAVVIKEGQVISQSHDKEETQDDATSHAEINAIKFASKILGRDLSKCKLISTHEPCPMCASAIVWAGIKKVVFGFSIEDSTKEGRKRIKIEADEIFKRSGAKIEIRGGLMKDECSILYSDAVRKEIKRLRGIDEKGLVRLADELTAKRKKWIAKNKKKIDKLTGDPLDIAYKVFLEKLSIPAEEAPVKERRENEIIIHSKNFCPTLEACKILGLDTKVICSALNEKSTDLFLKEVNPKLMFTRNYEKLRPRNGYCEEIISISAN